MSKVSATQVYNVTPSTLWKLVGAPGAIADWHPAIASSPVGADGTTRTCTLADGGEVHEKLTEVDDAGHRYSYEIASSPLPVEGYVATVRVSADGDGARLTWDSEFNVVGAPPAEIEGMIKGLYEAGLANVQSMLS